MKNFFGLFTILMKLASQMLISLKHIYFTLVKNTTSRFTLLFVIIRKYKYEIFIYYLIILSIILLLNCILTIENVGFDHILLCSNILILNLQMKNFLGLFSILMKLALQMLISLKHIYFTFIKNNIVKTMTILTLIRIAAYITISNYNMFTLLPISLFTNIDTSFLVLINIFDTDNSLYLLSLPLITPLKVFDYRIINETLDRYDIRDMNTRSVIIQRIFNLLTMLDDDFSQIIQLMEFELVNWIELASDEQLSNLVTDIFSGPLSLSNLKLKGLNTNLRIRKHLIYQMINNNKQWHIIKETPQNSNNIIDKIKTIILSSTGLNLTENPVINNMGFSEDPNQLFELDSEGFIIGVRTIEPNTQIQATDQMSDIESSHSDTEVDSDSESGTLVNDLDSDDEADIELMMDISDSELDSNPDTNDYDILNSDSDNENNPLLNSNDYTDIENLLIPFFLTLSNSFICNKIKSNKFYKILVNSKLLVTINKSKTWKYIKSSQIFKLLLTIILSIILKIIIMHIDTTHLLTSVSNSNSNILTSGSPLIIDMNISDFDIWFTTFVAEILNKPLPALPPLPLIELSILPPIIYKNKILEKILKDLLRLIIQYLINLLTSIVTSKAKSLLLSAGLLGLLKITNKGKEKESNSNSDTESFIQWPSESSYSQSINSKSLYEVESDTQSINSNSSSEVELDSEVESAIDRDVELERRIKAESRKSFLQEFINKAKIAPTKELQYEIFKVLFEIEKEKREWLDNPSSSIPTLRRTKPKWQERLSTTSTVLDLGTIQSEEIREEAVITPSSPYKSKLITISEEERWKLDKSQPDLPQESLEELLDEIINLNRLSDLKEDSKNRKLFRNIQRLNNSPTPTEDTQLRTPRTEHFTDYDFKTELDASETKSFRDTFDDLSIDDRSDKSKSKVNTRLKGNKKNKNKK